MATISIIFDILLYCIIAYFAFAIIASFIAKNRNAHTGEHTIFLRTNGLHLEIIVPYQSQLFDWKQFILPPDKKDNTQYLAFGWGDKDFYLNTPHWKDAKLFTVCKALFWPTKGVFRVTYITESIHENLSTVELKLTTDQMIKLHKNILKKLAIVEGCTAQYKCKAETEKHHFYHALGTYSLFNTCNTWVNRTLVRSGIRSCLWTIFDRAIMWQVKQTVKHPSVRTNPVHEKTTL